MATIEAKLNGAFREVHQCRKRYVVLMGGAGSGKSADTATTYILRLMQDRGRNLLAMRKSEITNRDSTFAELAAAIRRLKAGAYWKISKAPMEMTCANGNKIVFRGMNDEKQREKIKSITFQTGSLTDIWLEEATEFSARDIEILDDRLRGELPEGLFYQIKLTFNPVSADHWIKKLFFDTPDEDVCLHHSTYLDNRFLDKSFHRRMERRRRTDPEGYRVYGLGEWGELGGLILTNWQAEKVSQNPEDYDHVYYGQDFGYNDANALLEIGFRDGDIYILRELYIREKDTAEIIALAEAGGFSKKPEMFCDSAEPDRIKMWRRAGWRARAVSKEQGSVNAQIDYLKGRRIYIHPDCANTIAEIRKWRWAYDGTAGVYLDNPTGTDDHAMAALRYGVEGMRKPWKIFGVRTGR